MQEIKLRSMQSRQQLVDHTSRLLGAAMVMLCGVSEQARLAAKELLETAGPNARDRVMAQAQKMAQAGWGLSAAPVWWRTESAAHDAGDSIVNLRIALAQNAPSSLRTKRDTEALAKECFRSTWRRLKPSGDAVGLD